LGDLDAVMLVAKVPSCGDIEDTATSTVVGINIASLSMRLSCGLCDSFDECRFYL
jgi:hypothetical protein